MICGAPPLRSNTCVRDRNRQVRQQLDHDQREAQPHKTIDLSRAVPRSRPGARGHRYGAVERSGARHTRARQLLLLMRGDSVTKPRKIEQALAAVRKFENMEFLASATGGGIHYRQISEVAYHGFSARVSSHPPSVAAWHV